MDNIYICIQFKIILYRLAVSTQWTINTTMLTILWKLSFFQQLRTDVIENEGQFCKVKLLNIAFLTLTFLFKVDFYLFWNIYRKPLNFRKGYKRDNSLLARSSPYRRIVPHMYNFCAPYQDNILFRKENNSDRNWL